MRVRLQALGGLSREDLVTELELPAESRVGDAVSQLVLKPTPFLIYLLNGKRALVSTQLAEGDSLVVFPPALGG